MTGLGHLVAADAITLSRCRTWSPTPRISGVSGCHDTFWRMTISPVLALGTFRMPLGWLWAIPVMGKFAPRDVSLCFLVMFLMIPTVPKGCSWSSEGDLQYHVSYRATPSASTWSC